MVKTHTESKLERAAREIVDAAESLHGTSRYLITTADKLLEVPGPSVQDDATAAVYRERAHLVAYLAAQHPGEAWLSETDPDAPDWPVLMIVTAAGQMAWHINKTDLDLFPHVQWAFESSLGQPPKWDGHTTEEKYTRLQALTAAGL